MNENYLKEGSSIRDFRVVSLKKNDSHEGVVIKLVHDTAGTEVLHLHNEDRENFFSFIVKTPVYDNSGVSHILEHCVFQGTRKFPYSFPIVEVLKNSMCTYINGRTFPDRTLFMASSFYKKDYFNLMNILGEGVFFPLLTHESFLQEGCRIEFRDGENSYPGNLAIGGVVYNEMKSGLADIDRLVKKWSFLSLFPDTNFGYNSGGEPSDIVRLSYERMKDYYQKHYHPSNVKLFLYGNLPTQEILEFLQENFFKCFSNAREKIRIPVQPLWNEPKIIEKYYPLADHNDLKNKTYVTINWLLPRSPGYSEILAYELIEDILLKLDVSPLLEKLQKSGFRNNLLSSSGFELEYIQPVFSVGLRNLQAAKYQEFEEVILNALKEIVGEGIKPGVLNIALSNLEFRYKEFDREDGPLGYQLLRRLLPRWMYDLDPGPVFDFDYHMAELKARIVEDKDYLKRLISQILLKNKHRTTVVFKPDPVFWSKEKSKIGQYLTSEAIKNAQENAELFKAFSEEKKTKCDVQTRFSFSLPDNTGKWETTMKKEIHYDDIPFYYHDYLTHGLVYLDIGFYIGDIEDSLIDYLPLFGEIIIRSKVRGEFLKDLDYEFSEKVGAFKPWLIVGTKKVGDSSRMGRYIIFRIKTLERNFFDTLNVIKELFLNPDLDDKQRIEEILTDYTNSVSPLLIPKGHNFVHRRSACKMSPALATEERWYGISQLILLNSLVVDIDNRALEITSITKKLSEIIFSRKRIFLSFAGAEKIYQQLLSYSREFLDSFPKGARVDLNGKYLDTASLKNITGPNWEAVVIPYQVAFVSLAIKGFPCGTKENAGQVVLSNLLRLGYLYEKIREVGGAYGVMASNYWREGIFVFTSIRDPNIKNSFSIFRESLRLVSKGRISGHQINEAVFQTIKRDEMPLSIEGATLANLENHLFEISHEQRRVYRNHMLNLNEQDLGYIAGELLDRFDQGHSVIMSESKSLDEIKEFLMIEFDSIIRPPS